ncbi:transposase [Paracoccus marcusii]|uniref:transposase n=1 Tax=Paracoccus marcusii TaxID=59779 RepID=UPI0038621898
MQQRRAHASFEIKLITKNVRCRRWTADEKLQVVEGTLCVQGNIPIVACRNGAAPNLLHRWRRLSNKKLALLIMLSKELGIPVAEVLMFHGLLRAILAASFITVSLY